MIRKEIYFLYKNECLIVFTDVTIKQSIIFKYNKMVKENYFYLDVEKEILKNGNLHIIGKTHIGPKSVGVMNLHHLNSL